MALSNFEVLPYGVSALEGDSFEEESHTLSGYGVLHHDILYPRFEMRFVVSRPQKAKRKLAARVCPIDALLIATDL